MSAPAMNAFSPAPVRITTRTAASCFRSRTARRSSSVVGVFRALRTAGRLTVRIATGPSRSRRRLSKVMAMTTCRDYIPRPTGKKRDGRPRDIGIPIGDVRGSPCNERLMEFVGDPVERRERETEKRLAQRDARRQTTGERARDDEAEPHVAGAIRRLVG